METKKKKTKRKNETKNKSLVITLSGKILYGIIDADKVACHDLFDSSIFFLVTPFSIPAYHALCAEH
jgi:hypothetical protein